MQKLFKNYIVDFILAALLIALGVLMLPVLFGNEIINVILAVGLLAYVVIFLFGKLTRRRGIRFVVILVEFVVITVIAVGLVLQQFKVINISGVCKIVGACIWLHGVCSLLGEYFTVAVKDGKRCPPYLFALHIALVTLGTYMFAAPFFSDETIAWILAIGFMALGAALIALGIVFIPKKKKKKKKA